MLYVVLKNIIETSIAQYICQNCGGKVHDGSIHISHIQNNSVDLIITCPHCSSEAQIHAEIANINQEFLHSNEGQKMIQRAIKKMNNTIKESDIESLKKSLSETKSIEDLLQ